MEATLVLTADCSQLLSELALVRQSLQETLDLAEKAGQGRTVFVGIKLAQQPDGLSGTGQSPGKIVASVQGHRQVMQPPGAQPW